MMQNTRDEIRYGLWLVCALCALSFAACGTDGEDGDTTPGDDQPVELVDDTNFELVELDTLVGDHPVSQGKTLARYDSKFDDTLPKRYTELFDQNWLSPVRNQQSRGVCSIFSTVGLMEHLYLKAGMANPDFSEQYLQWSTKVEGRFFTNTGGSSGSANLQTINRFGVPEESAWPYEGSKWTASDDPSCGTDNKDVVCYTNGHPDDMTRAAKKYFLPSKDYVSSYTDSLKMYMYKNKRAVISGMDFFYQSWSHGGSSLGLNAKNKAAGAVVFPSPEAIKEGEEKPAGHSILLVGWDDDIAFPMLDTDGNPLRDDSGEIIYDKGFFIFKNSWGTGGTWGASNEFGKGYGYLSYRYVQAYGRSTSTSEPELEKPVVEICGDGLDNDANGASDCDDSACSANMACSGSANTEVFSSMASVRIPDNDSTGIQDKIDVTLDEPVGLTRLTLNVDHSWKGDLDILLIGPQGQIAVVAEANGEAGQGIDQTYVLEDFNGLSPLGGWTLDVSDNSRNDEGELVSWSLEFTF